MKKNEKKLIEKPSEKINELAQKIHNEGIDPGFSGYQPDIADYIKAIIQYLEENL